MQEVWRIFISIHFLGSKNVNLACILIVIVDGERLNILTHRALSDHRSFVRMGKRFYFWRKRNTMLKNGSLPLETEKLAGVNQCSY